jgi:hypothetical protein
MINGGITLEKSVGVIHHNGRVKGKSNQFQQILKKCFSLKIISKVKENFQLNKWQKLLLVYPVSIVSY